MHYAKCISFMQLFTLFQWFGLLAYIHHSWATRFVSECIHGHVKSCFLRVTFIMRACPIVYYTTLLKWVLLLIVSARLINTFISKSQLTQCILYFNYHWSLPDLNLNPLFSVLVSTQLSCILLGYLVSATPPWRVTQLCIRYNYSCCYHSWSYWYCHRHPNLTLSNKETIVVSREAPSQCSRRPPQSSSNTIRNSQSHIFLYKVKYHARIVKNKCADSLAKYQACHGNSLPAETTICTAGPGGNPFSDISWLAVIDVNQQQSGTKALQHGPSLTYLPNFQVALKPHMHSNHKVGYANSKTGYYSYYQILLPHVHRGISNVMDHVQTFSPNEAQYLPVPHRHPS